MKLAPHRLFFVLALATSVAAQTAQKFPDTLPGPVKAGMQRATMRGRVYHDTAEDGTLWARGDLWKASFGAGRMSFIPFFGSKAPHDYPLSLTLASVRLAGTELPFETGVQAARAEDEIRFDRGAFSEQYQLRPDSVEQSFVFDTLPARGELRLELALETELYASVCDEGLCFTNDLGHVSIGQAKVVDAAGHELVIACTLEGSTLVLDVPAGFVESAVLPLTVDPLINNFTIDATIQSDFGPDVAYDPTTDSYVVVYGEIYSVFDFDIYSMKISPSGVVSGGNYVDISTDYWYGGRVANNAYATQFMVVAQVTSNGPNPPWVVKGRQTGAALLNWGTPFQVSGTETGDKVAPDIGGDPTFAPPTYYFVVWERMGADTDIHGTRVASDGTHTSTQFIDNSAGWFDYVPRISKTDGNAPFSTQEWTVVWERYAGAGNHDVFGAQVHWDGTLTHASFPIDQALGYDDENPVVSSLLDAPTGERLYLVAAQENQGTADHDIRLWEYRGTTFVTQVPLYYLENDGLATQDQRAPEIDSDGRRFYVTYSEQYSTSTTDYDTWLTILEDLDIFLYASEVHLSLGYTTNYELDSGITNAHGSSAPARFLAAWDMQRPDFTWDIFGAVGVAPVATPFCVPIADSLNFHCPCGNDPATGFPGGCANSANAYGAGLYGSGATANDSVLLSAAGMPATATAIFLQGETVIYPAAFGDGARCIAGQLLRLGIEHSVGGSCAYPSGTDLSILQRCTQLGAPIPAGSRRVYQSYYRDPASYACAATYNITNALAVDW